MTTAPSTAELGPFDPESRALCSDDLCLGLITAEGGTAVSAVVAVTFSTLETTAAVGNTVALTLTGNFTAHATDLSGAVSTSASGDADGSGAAVGASVALNVAEHTVTATTGSSFTTPGTVELVAVGASAVALALGSVVPTRTALAFTFDRAGADAAGPKTVAAALKAAAFAFRFRSGRLTGPSDSKR